MAHPAAAETALQGSPHATAAPELITAVFGVFFLGGAVGAGTAACLRRAELAWTWALGSLLAPALLLVTFRVGLLPLGPGSAIAFAGALGFSFGAIGWGLHARLEDRRAGADREADAARRRGVLDAPRRRLAERHRRKSAALSDGLPIGRTSRGELVCVPRGSARSGRHVLIPGATGAGKTTSLATLLAEYVLRSGFGAVVLEAKSDAALRDAAQDAARARGVPFQMVSPTGPVGYDPLSSGEVDERSERLLAVESWGSADAAFYRQAASPFLRLVIRALDRSPQRATLASVAHRCDPDELENLAEQVGGSDLLEEVDSAISGLRADERRAIAGLRARLRNLASSDFAHRWLDPARSGTTTVDLRQAIARREVVYFRLDTDRSGNVGRAIAQMALLDLGAAASSLMDAGVGTFVAIDEFGALEAPALERLFARGRAAGFSVAVGTQTLADLRAAGPAVRERIGATVSTILCHRVGGQDDAEWISQLVGTVPAWETTVRTNGWGLPTAEGTRTRGHRFEVHPTELQRLGPGEACVARLDTASRRRSDTVRVVPPWQRMSARPSRVKEEPVGLGRRSTV